MTAEQLKLILSSPLALFLLMYVGSAVSALKQIVAARRGGVDLKCSEYIAHWPETLVVIFSNLLAFAVLIETNTLNLVSALSVGYGLNSLADLLQREGRSSSVAGK